MILATILITAILYKIVEAIILKTNPLIIINKIVNLDKHIIETFKTLKN